MGTYIGKWTVFFKLESFKANSIKRTPDPISDLIKINLSDFLFYNCEVFIKFQASTGTAETVQVPVRTK